MQSLVRAVERPAIALPVPMLSRDLEHTLNRYVLLLCLSVANPTNSQR